MRSATKPNREPALLEEPPHSEVFKLHLTWEPARLVVEVFPVHLIKDRIKTNSVVKIRNCHHHRRVTSGSPNWSVSRPEHHNYFLTDLLS